MELKDTTHLQKGGKIKIVEKALSEVGWEKGEVIAQYVNDDKDAVVLMRAKDVLSAVEIEK
ncbi:unnamed protein product [marine sediment metagenome]|uniref:Uncharacterized protein n=1 Tax=marine sediment metagenome TaxID=412755 RepID=X1DXW9_9ZZZZ